MLHQPIDRDTVSELPIAHDAIRHALALMAAGLDYHELSGHRAVIFNPAKISEKDLAAADRSGKRADTT